MNYDEVPIKYIYKECNNCGRYRIEIYADGRKVCEKCHYNQEEKKFDHHLFKYI